MISAATNKRLSEFNGMVSIFDVGRYTDNHAAKKSLSSVRVPDLAAISARTSIWKRHPIQQTIIVYTRTTRRSTAWGRRLVSSKLRVFDQANPQTLVDASTESVIIHIKIVAVRLRYIVSHCNSANSRDDLCLQKL